MWEVSQEDVERVLGGLITLDLSKGVEGTVQASLHVMRERRVEMEQEPHFWRSGTRARTRRPGQALAYR